MTTREIKFRAYSKSLGGYIVEPIFVGENKVYVLRGKILEEVPDAQIIQYTGLKDKNGKEIYEGDIIKIQRSKFPENDYKLNTGTIEWCDKCCMGYRVQFIGIGNNERLSYFEKVEIIGNIYENPELLK